jgi:multidrug resistance protein MdtO
MPTMASSRASNETVAWFRQFLETELTPYPGRAWVVARITIAATITMVLVMTFRIPFGYLAALYTLLLGRENPILTFRMGIKIAFVYALATTYGIFSIMTVIDDPLTHFLWIVISLLLVFYVIHINPDYFSSVGFGLTMAVMITLWDQAKITVNQRTESTLWVGFSVLVGSAVTIAVEFILRKVNPATDITQDITRRLSAVEGFLRQMAAERPISEKLEKEITLFAALGTSKSRGQLLRSGQPSQLIAPMNAAIALVGRLVDLTASMHVLRSNQPRTLSTPDRERCLYLADQISQLRLDLQQGQLPRTVDISDQHEPSELPLLSEMQRIVELIPHSFSDTRNLNEPFLKPVLDGSARHILFVPDAFTNPDHLKFAIRGTAATMLAYCLYQAIAWPGLSTAIVTCIITAMSTIGSHARQKQFFRLAGAILGGIVFGIGAQIFVLPHVDSIVGFTVLFVLVTAFSAWIATANPRFYFLGVQVAVAFYILHLQEFAFQSSLTVARDRVFGVLLGLFSMWVVFDRLWVNDAQREMQDALASSFQLLAELIEQSAKEDRMKAATRVLQLRNQINNGLNSLVSQADSVLIDFGAARERNLAIRNDINRWHPTLGVLLQLQITFLEYLFTQRIPTIPPSVAAAEMSFERDMTIIFRAMSTEIEGKTYSDVPDIQSSSRRLRREIQNQYRDYVDATPPSLLDLIALTHNLASIVAPLHADIRASYASR